MCLNKTVRILAMAGCLAAMFTGTARAENVPDGTRLKVKLERLPLRCTPPLYRAFVTAETGQFTFVIPGGLRVKGDCGTKLKIGNLDGNCLITFSILDPTPRGPHPLDADTYRDVVQARYPRGKIVEQLCPAAAGREGVGFDVQWETTNKFAQCTRTAFVPTSMGLLEFTATSNPKNFPDLRYQLNLIMAGFQAAGPDEKLEVPPVSATDGDRTDARPPTRNPEQRTVFLAASHWVAV